MFDFDQTLTFVQSMKSAVRGGEKTMELLEYMNSQGISWYINTAAGAGAPSGIAVSTKQLRIPLSPAQIIPNQPPCFRTFKTTSNFFDIKQSFNGVDVGICDNIISAGYNKEYAVDFILQQPHIKVPTLFIFVDDNAANIRNVWRYFKTTRPDVHFVGVVYEPAVKPEADHLAELEQLSNDPGFQVMSDDAVVPAPAH